jgi:hypothetical protein
VVTDGSEKPKPKAVIFQSYGWVDAAEVAQRLVALLREAGYEVWIDKERIREQTRPEEMFPEAIRRGIEEADVVLVLMSPHSVRLPGDASNPDNAASVCLNEIILAHGDRKPIVPVIVVPCEPPFLINIIKRIDLCGRTRDDAMLREGVQEILDAIDAAQQRGSSIYIPQLERLHPLDFRNELVRGAGQFTGRKWLFDRCSAWLTSRNNCLLIEGDAGSGKSAIVSELIRRDPGGRMLAYHFCRADQLTTIQPAEFVRSLAAMIGARIDAYGTELNGDELRTRLVGDGCAADPLTALLGSIVNPLSALPDLGLRYILVDALDEALQAASAHRSISIPQLLARALPDFPPWLKLIVTTRRDERITTLFQNAEIVRLSSDDPLQREDVAAFLERHLPVATDKSLGQAAINRSAGNFLYARQVADAVDRGEIGLADIDTLPRDLSALYARAFYQHFPDAGSYANAARVLGAILAAKEPLTQNGLAEASGVDLQETVRPVLEALTGYVVARPGPENELVYTLFHKSLADWLSNPAAGAFRIDPAKGRQRLLDWCRNWRTAVDPYPLRNLIGHLLDVNAIDEALAAVHGGLFAKRDARMVRADLADTMALTLALIDRGQAKAAQRLATSGSPWQRDGATAALIAAPPEVDILVRAVASQLARVPIADPENPSSDAMAARRAAIRICEARSYDDLLLAMAKDKAPAVRVVLGTMLYHHWLRRRDDGWRLIDGLAAEMFGLLSLPNIGTLEVLGHMSLAILNNHRGDAPTMTRLLGVWRRIAQRITRGPIVRTVAKKWILDALLKLLISLMNRQPAYQPFNTREMDVCFARASEKRGAWAISLACLEHPEGEIAPMVEALLDRGQPFDVYLMLVSERAMICHARHDLTGTVDALERLFREGTPWFRQSVLYALFHILQQAQGIDQSLIERYGAMTGAFFVEDGAAMTTTTGTYAFAPHLAWPEIVAETHQPGREPWLLSRLMESAIKASDADRIDRVFKATDLVSFAYGRSTLALSLIERANAIGGIQVEQHLVETLANIRFQDEALVDEFLDRPEFERLKPLVKAAAPTIRGEDIPTWVDGFVVQSMLGSEAFHREYCAAFRRALTARSASECLRQILVWVIGLLAGEADYAHT